jgi:hypothetical protein
MAKKKAPPLDVVLDEQGDYFPAASALCAFLHEFAGEPQYDGTMVEVSAYLAPEFLFEVIALTPIVISGQIAHRVGEVLYAFARELKPLNAHTQAYINLTSEVQVEIYETDAYDLRDKLADIDVFVTVEAVSKWDSAQRTRIWIYADAVKNNPSLRPVKTPKELL